jgi:hypothetical protein
MAQFSITRRTRKLAQLDSIGLPGEDEHAPMDLYRHQLHKRRPNPVRALSKLAFLTLLLPAFAFGQEPHSSHAAGGPARSPLEATISRFDVKDAVLRDGLSELSLKNIDDLHLGFEEIIRERIQDDPRVQSPHFSLHLRGKTVREVMDALCSSDPRYTWSIDGTSINVYPKAAAGDPAYLFNHVLQQILVSGIPNPDQALTPLAALLPREQIGYAGIGDDPEYAKPWTATFEHLTVRQFINRIAEHLGPRTSWTWQGTRGGRMFTFHEGGFLAAPAIE